MSPGGEDYLPETKGPVETGSLTVDSPEPFKVVFTCAVVLLVSSVTVRCKYYTKNNKLISAIAYWPEEC